MYTPGNEELEAMGFIPRIWEWVIYRWDYHGLTYHTGDWYKASDDDEDKEKWWDIGSWNVKLNITSREEIEYIQKLLLIKKSEVCANKKSRVLFVR